MTEQYICIFFTLVYTIIYAAHNNKNDSNSLVIVANMWLIASFIVSGLK